MERQKQPGVFHCWLKQKQDEGHEVQVVTTNIDTLFERAGIVNVYHVHGDLRYQSCAIGCGFKWVLTNTDEVTPRCPRCRCAKTKPNVIFYGERCEKEYSNGNAILRKCCNQVPTKTILIDIGSSHTVYRHATKIIEEAKSFKVLVNPDRRLYKMSLSQMV